MIETDGVRAGSVISLAAGGAGKAVRPLRIGYVWQYDATHLSPVSATALHVGAVVRQLRSRGHQVRMITVRDGQPHVSEDLQNWRPVQANRRRSNMAAYRLAEKVVRGTQSRLKLPYLGLFESDRFSEAVTAALADCDLLYERFWLLASGGQMAAQRLGIPIFYEVNGDLVEEYRQLGIHLSSAQWAAVNFVTRHMFASAGRVITVSEPLRQATLRRWKLAPEQVTAVSNGAQVELFAAQAGDDPSLRIAYGLDESPLVIFVGSFKPWHGLDLLVEAFSRLPQEIGAKLMMVGDGPTRPELEAQAQRLGLGERVIFTGAVPHAQVANLLRHADVAVLNPRRTLATESQSPLKLFEYMAAGLAIVGPALPNIESIVTHGENALLVEPDSPDALASALADLLRGPVLRARLGESARRTAFERHSWESTVIELERIFAEEER